MLVRFTETTVAHPSSFKERAMHACTVHRNKRGSWIPRLLKRGLYILVLFTNTNSLTSRVLKKELHMLVLFKNTNVAQPSSFPEGAMHTCTVHKNKLGSWEWLIWTRCCWGAWWGIHPSKHCACIHPGSCSRVIYSNNVPDTSHCSNSGCTWTKCPNRNATVHRT